MLELTKLEMVTMIDLPSFSEINAPFYRYDDLTQKLPKELEIDQEVT